MVKANQVYTAKQIKLMQEKGLYRGSEDKDFRTDRQIKKELALKGELGRVYDEVPPLNKNFEYWSDRFRRRQEEYNETVTRKDHVTISFKDDVILNFIGDTHVGHPSTRYDRLEQEMHAIVGTPESYVILAGDLVDGFFFNPAQMEQMEQSPEQYAYIDSMMKFLADEKRLLIGMGGDHDGWPKKMGIDPYYKFSNDLNAHYMHGVGHITTNVGEQTYKLTGAHQLPGFSMYNNLHPQMRASKEVQGADLYFSAHTHRKGHSTQPMKEFGGEARTIHYISLGPYKATDEYARKKGFAAQTEEEMFGCAVTLKADRRLIVYHNNILDANE